LQAPEALFKGLQICFQPVDVIFDGQSVILVERRLGRFLFDHLDHFPRQALRFHGVSLDFLGGVPGLDQVFPPLQHLLVNTRYLRFQILGHLVALRGASGIGNDKQKDDGPKTAANAVDERKAEDTQASTVHLSSGRQ
jgi:hypothetical protein